MEDDFQGPYLNPEELGLMLAAWDKELALLNAVLEIEVEQREREFATLEGCSFCGQFEEGHAGQPDIDVTEPRLCDAPDSS